MNSECLRLGFTIHYSCFVPYQSQVIGERDSRFEEYVHEFQTLTQENLILRNRNAEVSNILNTL